MMIKIRKYEDRLLRIAHLFEGFVEEVKIVPSPKAWCTDKGLSENSEYSAGKCLYDHSTGKHIILLADTISEIDRKAIIDAMSFNGSSPGELEILKDEWLFVEHLLLHECAHAANHEFTEHQCDDWAFDMMKEIED